MKWEFPKTGWIWHEKPIKDAGEPKLVLFRKSLVIEHVPEEAKVRLSADSRYRLYVNGHSVAFGPCKGDRQVWFYDEVDIAPFLKEGVNILAGVVLRYSMLAKGNYSVSRTAMPGLYLEGTMKADGACTALVADNTWKYKVAENIRFVPENPYLAFLTVTEIANGDVSSKGWQYAAYDDSEWGTAYEYHFMEVSKAVSPGNLLPRPIPPMFEQEHDFSKIMCVRESSYKAADWDKFLGGAPIDVAPFTREIVELDAGELTTGFLELAVQNGKGAKIEILTSEAYAYEPEQGSYMPMPKKGDRTDWEKGRLYGVTDTYTVGGFGDEAGAEQYEPFWFRTFRFIRLSIQTGEKPLRLSKFRYRETGYPLNVVTQVETSDTDLGEIWDISLRTLRRCMHETYEDCPFYEQLQYAMDTRLQILYTYSVSADDRLARRCIDDFHRSLRYDGLTNCCYPTVSANVIPGFSLYYVMMIYDHMMYFGDKELVRKYLPTVQSILAFFERNRDERGLVGAVGSLNGTRFWSFVDWTPEWNATTGIPDAVLSGPITIESFLYAYTLGMASQLADYVGLKEQANIYTGQMMDVKAAINMYCKGKGGLYQDGPGIEKYSQHSQVWAVLTETAPENEWHQLMKQTLEPGVMPKCSVAMAFYLFRAVEKAGLYAQSSVLWEPWREMLRNNLTTCEEDQVNRRSDCHAWGSVALYELPAVILGVRPAEPGYKTARVQPTPGYLSAAKGVAVTPKGNVLVQWRIVDGEMMLDVEAPDGMEILNC